MKEAIEYAEKSHYKSVIISNSLAEPQIFVLFYNKVSPSEIQALNLSKSERSTFGHAGFVDLEMGKYHIVDFSERFSSGGNTLFIVTPYELPLLQKSKLAMRHLKVIKGPDGRPLIHLVEVSGETP